MICDSCGSNEMNLNSFFVTGRSKVTACDSCVKSGRGIIYVLEKLEFHLKSVDPKKVKKSLTSPHG